MTGDTACFATTRATLGTVDLVFHFFVRSQRPSGWPALRNRDLGANVFFSSYRLLKKRADYRACLVGGRVGHINRHRGAESLQVSHQLVEIERSACPKPLGLHFRQASQQEL